MFRLGPLAALVVLLCAACAPVEPEPGGGEVVVLHVEPGVDVQVEEDRLIFPLAGHEDLLGRAPGDILISDRGTGFLRRILAVERAGQTLVVNTAPADLADVLHDGTVGLPVAAGGKSDSAGGGFAGFHFELEGVKRIHQELDLDIDLLSAHVSLQPRLDIDAQVRRGELESFRLVATGTLDASVVADVTIGGHLEKTFRQKLWTDRHIAVQLIGDVPVVEVIELSVGVGFTVAADGEARLRVGGRAVGPIKAGAGYRRRGEEADWTSIAEQQLVFTPSVEVLGGEATVTVEGELFSQVEVRFYDAAGPVLTLSPYVSVAHELGSTAWTPAVGVRAEVAALLKLPFLRNHEWTPFDAQLFDARAVFPPVQYGAPAAPPPSGCGELDYQGECDGETVRWCEDGAVSVLECADGCGWVDDDIGYDCL